MHRYLVTGTDTDVGKTRVTAALARALKKKKKKTTVVKLVQTGLDPGIQGDAALAGTLAGVPHMEFARFRKAADPWSAALADGMPAVHAEDLARVLEQIDGSIVCEGAGGLAVPLNRIQNFGTLAQLANLEIVIAVGLRLGCMNHALLTAALCDQMNLKIAGAVLVDRWGASDDSYVADVRRALQGKLTILGILPFAVDAPASVEAGARLFSTSL